MLKPEQIASVKGRGFLINRGTECFSGRLVCAGAVFTAADLHTISEIAEKFGSGKVTFTSACPPRSSASPSSRLMPPAITLPSVASTSAAPALKYAPSPHVKGTTCVYGNYDTQALAKELHEKILRRLGKCQTAAQVQNRHRRLPE